MKPATKRFLIWLSFGNIALVLALWIAATLFILPHCPSHQCDEQLPMFLGGAMQILVFGNLFVVSVRWCIGFWRK